MRPLALTSRFLMMFCDKKGQNTKMPPPWKMMSASAPDVPQNGCGEAGGTPSPWLMNAKEKQSTTSNGFHNNRGFGNADNNNAEGGNQVKVTFWPATATEDDLKLMFSEIGELKRARMLTPREGRDITLCFVTFGTSNEAQTAVSQLNGHEVEGRRIRVEMDDADNKRQPERLQAGNNSSNQIKVFSWPASLNEDDMRNLFEAAGSIQRVKVLPARDGRDITLGFVTFSSNEEVLKAVENFNDYEIEGKKLRIEETDKSSSGRGFGRQEGGMAGDRVQKGGRGELQVRCCPASVNEDEFRDMLSAVGQVTNLKVLPPRDGMDITLAFVTYGSENEAKNAVEKFDGFEYMGKRLRVSLKENRSNNAANNSQETNSARPWGRPNGSSEGNATSFNNGSSAAPAGKPWGQSGMKAGAESGSQSRFVSNGSESKDDGIFIEDGEMNENFSFGAGFAARAPVIYVPPPPPENEEEIFDDTCHQGINFEKYDKIPFEVTGKDPPKTISTFEESDLHQVCMDNLRRAKYKTPTPVQKSVLPAVCHGRDVMACAQTGSGKTAAYLLPIISNLMKNGVPEAETCQSACPNALIVAPTRELAIQIFLEARKFAYGSKLRTVVIYGGVSVSHQLGTLCDGCNILVATPGRLNDFIDRGRVSLRNIQFFVLDEADRMLDMGFESAIKKIATDQQLPAKGDRQTLMSSATFPESIQLLAAQYLHDYIFITVGRVGSASSDILQSVLEVQGSQKRAKLEEILLESVGERILVFVETKRSADFLASFLSQRSFPATSISSDRTQEERECALRDFRTGKAPVLIATAVAARGLDIPNVKHVINFDLPAEVDEYIHRIGRTGRIGNQGRATAFFDRMRDDRLARSLVKVLSEARQEVPEWLEEIAMSAVGTGFGPSSDQFSSRDRRKENRGGFRSQPNMNGQGLGFVQKSPPAMDAAPAPMSNFSESKAEEDGDMWC